MNNEKKLITQSTNLDSFYSGKHWNTIGIMAQTFLQSGALPVAFKNPAQVVMVLQAGREAGLKPVESLNSFYFVNGKLTMYGQRLIAQVIKAGYMIEWGECNETTANVKISREDRGSNEKTYTLAEAQKKGLTKNIVWSKYPENMLRFKAFGLCARFFCPEALDGFYAKEEIESDEELSQTLETRTIQEAKTIEMVNPVQIRTIRNLNKSKGKMEVNMLKAYNLKKIELMTKEQADKIILMLEKTPDIQKPDTSKSEVSVEDLKEAGIEVVEPKTNGKTTNSN